MPVKSWDRVPIDAQSIDAPLSLAAVFLVVTVAIEPAARLFAHGCVDLLAGLGIAILLSTSSRKPTAR